MEEMYVPGIRIPDPSWAGHGDETMHTGLGDYYNNYSILDYT